MSEPRIPNDLCLGPHRLDDILRIFERSGQWFLSNLTRRTQLPAIWLADFLAHLHAAGMAEPKVLDGDLYYKETLSITRENLRTPLTRAEVERLLKRVCAKAEEMNADGTSGIRVCRIYLYGSCLRDAEAPNDIDLGLEILQAGRLLQDPPKYPFAPPSAFDLAVRPLALRKPRLISLLHIDEVRAIGAPHQLIWEAGRSRLKNEPLQTPKRTSDACLKHEEELRRRKIRQEELDAFVHRVQQIKDWPVMPKITLSTGEPAPLAQYRDWQENDVLLLRAHLHCLPDGLPREEIQTRINTHLAKSAKLCRQWRDAAPLILPFIHASQHHTPWQLRPNGRLVKRHSDQ